MKVGMLVYFSGESFCCLIYPSVGCSCSRSFAVDNVVVGAAVVAGMQRPLVPKGSYRGHPH